MKVGIIMFQNMRYAPFLETYERILDHENADYEIIYFNRDASLQEENDDKHIPINWHGKGTLSAPKFEKLINFFSYRLQLLKLLNSKQYSHLIILTTFPAVLISGYLKKNYAHKYIVDIRDYTQEHNAIYFALERTAIENSAFSLISSAGFVNFLPKSNYVRCHNISDNANLSKCVPLSVRTEKRIIISYIGTISYEQQCLELIILVANDDRFEFHFYGNEAHGNTVSAYIAQLGNKRVKMMGAFTPDQKAQIYADTDIVFNCYGNKDALVKYAISNKYYDGALYGKPLLVSPNTAMAEESGAFAYAIDLESAIDLEGVYQWYQKLDEDAFMKYAQSVIKRSLDDNRRMKERVVRFLQR